MILTPTAILAAGTAGIFILLLVVVWHLVPLLRQARRSAAALEQFLEDTRPRVDDTLDQLRRVLTRADTLLGALESAPRATSAVAETVAKFASVGRSIMETVSALSVFLAGLARLWNRPEGDAAEEASHPSREGG